MLRRELGPFSTLCWSKFQVDRACFHGEACARKRLENRLIDWARFNVPQNTLQVILGTIFTALHAMQTRSSDENSVCLSVCLSVKRVLCDQTVERSVQIYIPYERTFSLVFWEEEWLVGATPSTWNFGSTGPRWSKIADFEPIIARSASAVTPSEKSSINANRKSTTHFRMSQRKMNIIRCP